VTIMSNTCSQNCDRCGKKNGKKNLTWETINNNTCNHNCDGCKEKEKKQYIQVTITNDIHD
jgi:hypothetical protein